MNAPQRYIIPGAIFSLIFCIIYLATGCSERTSQSGSSDLILKTSKILEINEPSGITWNEDYTAYWVADGSKGMVIKTDTAGDLIRILPFIVEDIEAVCFDRRDSTLWITDERNNLVIHLTDSGEKIAQYSFPTGTIVNKGLEGITINNLGQLCIVNEKNPSVLIIADSTGKTITTHDLSFASDVSDIEFNSVTGEYYILSDESKAVFIWQPDFGVKKTLPLPAQKYEGIAVNPHAKTITVVNDDDRSMLVFLY